MRMQVAQASVMSSSVINKTISTTQINVQQCLTVEPGARVSECSPDIEDYRPHDEREHGEEEHSEPRSGEQAVLQRAAAHRDLSDFTSRLQS